MIFSNFQILILGITGLLIANIYYDGKLMNYLKKWKKYYQISFIAIIGLGLFIFIKKNPEQGSALFNNANQYIKYMPIDKNTKDFITPFFNNNNNYSNNNYSNNNTQINRILKSGNNSNKRSVSETKKKFVASKQDWTCNDCKCKLPAWFEIDHNIRLDQGGTNHIDNLVALCRNCHGKKTALENL